MFGLLFLILGVLGQYIAQIYEEVKERPNYIVKQEIGF
jgi:dolichol-phosphate mannosyltransferase